jgi:hypothetical protein
LYTTNTVIYKSYIKGVKIKVKVRKRKDTRSTEGCQNRDERTGENVGKRGSTG